MPLSTWGSKILSIQLTFLDPASFAHHKAASLLDLLALLQYDIAKMNLNKIKSLLAKTMTALFVGFMVATTAPGLIGQQATVYAAHCTEPGFNHDKNAGSPTVAACVENPIFIRLRQIVRFLSAGVGIVVAIMVVVGGMQYITAADNPQKLEASKSRIANALGGLFMWLLSGVALDWLVPGVFR